MNVRYRKITYRDPRGEVWAEIHKKIKSLEDALAGAMAIILFMTIAITILAYKLYQATHS